MSMRRYACFAGATALAAALAAAPAMAQKSKDTLRMPLSSPIQGVSYYFDPKPDTAYEIVAVFDGIVGYDEVNGSLQPLLAKSWQRVGDTAIEFDFRDDVKWHDGERFDADDVAYTIDWLLDPKTRIRFKNIYAWIGKVEKLGPYKLRITAKTPTPYDLARYAYLFYMLPEHVHGKMDDKLAFTRKPVGTGMYKVRSVDANDGIVFERNAAYAHGGKAKPMSNIGRVVMKFMPDPSTQIAEFIAGNLDIIPRDLSLDQALELSKVPNATLSAGQNFSLTYVAFDAKGRSGNKAVTDIRVRKALAMAIDGAAIARLKVPQGFGIPHPESMCFKTQAACVYGATLPPLDVAGARKLLAEAGYPNGFNLELTSFTSTREDAEAISGMLSRIGVKATVDTLLIGPYRKKQGDGKIQTMVGSWPGGGLPDVAGTIDFIYAAPASRDYHGDAEVKRLGGLVNSTIDKGKRDAYARQMFDRATEQAYFIPLSPTPTVVVHSKDLAVRAGTFGAFGLDAWGMNWK